MFELIKIGNHNVIDLAERRFKAKIVSGEYHSVQFFLNGSGLSHLFRLRYNTSNGPYVLVKQDSSVFKVRIPIDREHRFRSIANSVPIHSEQSFRLIANSIPEHPEQKI